MSKKPAYKDCGLYTVYSDKSRSSWETIRFHGINGLGRKGRKKLEIIAKKTGRPINGPILRLEDVKEIVENAEKAGVIRIPGTKTLEQITALSSGSRALRAFIYEIGIESSVLFSWINSHQKKGISEKAYEKYTASFRNHVDDTVMPSSIITSNVSENDIRSVMDKLRSKGCSEEVVHNCLMLVRKTMAYLICETGIIKSDPTDKLFTKQNPRKYVELFTKKEIRELLKNLEAKKEAALLGNYYRRIYVAIQLLVHTGMRLSECRALKVDKLSRVCDENAKPTNIYKIIVDCSWDDKTKTIKTTKTSKYEIYYIWQDVALMLLELYKENPYGNGYFFWSDRDKEKPIAKEVYYNYVYPALDEIGIDKTERKRRNLCIHKIRHFFVTESISLKTLYEYDDTHESKNGTKTYDHSNTFLRAVLCGRVSRDILKELNPEQLTDVYA